ncbi:hypothetical protein [Thiomonas sp. FB-Cd]|uniref:hypothetical protein n=1 Tax=Thiomonas sp. FB-Cd TaxID=1158292 RepID=UPI0004DEE81B|nr:hypothetical protein [Thiomonas sp. FB-Cd]
MGAGPQGQFSPWIWDPDLGTVEPADREETEATFGLLSRFIADLALKIRNNLECFEPLFLKSPKLAHLVDWFDGLLGGTRFHPRLWEHVVQQAPNVFEVIGRLSDPKIKLRGQNSKRWLRSMCWGSLLPWEVMYGRPRLVKLRALLMEGKEIAAMFRTLVRAHARCP